MSNVILGVAKRLTVRQAWKRPLGPGTPLLELLSLAAAVVSRKCHHATIGIVQWWYQ